jgi:hypothetical protein
MENYEDTQDFETEEDKTSTEETQENENELDSKTLLIQKKKMREQRDSAREELNKLKEELAKSKSDDSSATKTKEEPKDIDKRLSKIEFAQQHPSIDSKVLTEVLEVAEAKGIKPEEALELPIVKTYLKSIEDEKEIADATPNSNRSPKIKPEKPIGEMTREEHKAYWEKQQGLK